MEKTTSESQNCQMKREFLKSKAPFIRQMFQKYRGTEGEDKWRSVLNESAFPFEGASEQLNKNYIMVKRECELYNFRSKKKNVPAKPSDKPKQPLGSEDLDELLKDLGDVIQKTSIQSEQKPLKHLIKMKLPAFVPPPTSSSASSWGSAQANQSMSMMVKEPKLLKDVSVTRRNSLPFNMIHVRKPPEPVKPSKTLIAQLINSKACASNNLKPPQEVLQAKKVETTSEEQKRVSYNVPKMIGKCNINLVKPGLKKDHPNNGKHISSTSWVNPERKTSVINTDNFKVAQSSEAARKLVVMNLSKRVEPLTKAATPMKFVITSKIRPTNQKVELSNSDKKIEKDDSTSSSFFLNAKSDKATISSKASSESLAKVDDRVAGNHADDGGRRVSYAKKKILDQTKELKRLHENIVKDDVVLPQRRSLKRASALRDSPLNTSSDGKETLKRSKNQGADEDLHPVLNQNDKTAIKKDQSATSDHKLQLRSKRERSSLSVSSQELPETTSTVRVTRKSVAAIEKSIEPSPKKFKVDSEVLKLDEIKKNFDLKPCSIPLSNVPELQITQPSGPQKQMAKKSTNQRQQVYRKFDGRFEAASKKKFKRKPLRLIKTVVIENKISESEWEDIEDTATTASEEEPLKHESSPELMGEMPDEDLLIDCQTVCNIGYSICRDGATYRCRVATCKFKTNEKNKFVKHIETDHKLLNWNGRCNICLKSMQKDENSIIVEFIHMMEEHLLKEVSLFGAAARKTPQVSTKKLFAPQPQATMLDAKSHIIKGIDSILSELHPLRKLDSEGTVKNMTNMDENEESPSAQTFVRVVELPYLGTGLVEKPQLHQPNVSPKPIVPQTKVISKNIVGRVISISQIPGFSNALKQVNKQTDTPTVGNFRPVHPSLKPQASINEFASSKSPTHIVKYVIQKPTHVGMPKPPFSDVNEDGKTFPVVKIVDEHAKFVPISNQKNVVVTNLEVSKDDMFCFQESLRPWLKKNSKKDAYSTATMLTRVALTANYKCLGLDCNFFTCSHEAFMLHLMLHDRCTLGDRINFLSCAYCSDVRIDPNDLIRHIETVHKYDKYQCNYCFYRSCVDFNVLTHQNHFHKMKPRIILTLHLIEEINPLQELERVKRLRADHVPPIVCLYCKAHYYIFTSFLNHLAKHPNVTKGTKCSKCGEKCVKGNIHKHLIYCHGYGLYQCCYCRFGTNTFEIMSNHIATKHPSQLPLFCERSQVKSSLGNPCVSTVESTSLKRIKQKIPKSFLVESPTNVLDLKNCLNIGKLGPKVHIQGPYNIQHILRGQLSMRIPSESKKKPEVAKNPHSYVLSGQFSTRIPNESSAIRPGVTKHPYQRLYRPMMMKVSNEESRIIIPQPALPRDVSPKKPQQIHRPQPNTFAQPKSSGLQIQSVFSLSNVSKKSFNSLTQD